MGDQLRLLWFIPLFCAITIYLGVTKRSQQIVSKLTGMLPVCLGLYWYLKVGNDLARILTYGAYLSLIFGAALFLLPRKTK